MSTETLAPPKTKSQALRSYHVADFPALIGREEEWRFTPLARLRGLAAADGSSPMATSPKLEYGSLPDGVTVCTVDRSDPRIGSVLVPFDRVSALAYGGFDAANLITVGREVVMTEPALLRLVGGSLGGGSLVGNSLAGGSLASDSTDAPTLDALTLDAPTLDTLTLGHTFIDIGALAEASIVLEHTGSLTLADNVEVSLGDGARLTLITVADWAPDAVQAQHLKFRIGRDAKLTHVQVTLGGDLVRQYITVEYAGRGGDAELYGLYFATAPIDPASGTVRGGAHFEHRLLVDHSQPDCRSYVGYRGALQGDGAHTVWVGDVLIRAEATGTDTYEINRNLVLSDGARADSVPNLEIETGEVAGAGHASATGRFDDEQLFYLMARGIPEDQARRLVVRGFFAELLNKIPVIELRDRLSRAIDSRLATAELGLPSELGVPA